MGTLNKIVSGTIPIDMNVMRDILANLILKQESRLETSPHDTIADFIIGDLLYGQQCRDVSYFCLKCAWFCKCLYELHAHENSVSSFFDLCIYIIILALQLDTRLNKKLWYEHLLTKTVDCWIGLIRQYFIDGPLVLIRGIPSIQEATRLEEEEKARIEARKLQIGEEGLKMWHDRVEEAKKTNEVILLHL